MREASRVVLGGVVELGSDAKVVRWPERYSDKRGEMMWETVGRLSVGERQAEDSGRMCTRAP